ncbi:cupin domain-containing protein [Streptomyces marincola]|uniref:cupin n=1 Tax=Streptomyces marincola TaxID=2878388 RepID=UPI001CF1F614|nr:cupin [Streptomyces marincola]UCM87763.1 cupin [Streptomyces marincola]
MTDLTQLADRHLSLAREADHGRSAHLFLHDGPLRQSVIALVAGAELEEHNAPPAASLLVLRGRVRLSSAAGDTDLGASEVMAVPQARHGVTAVEDAVVVLTSVTAHQEPVVVHDTRRTPGAA